VMMNSRKFWQKSSRADLYGSNGERSFLRHLGAAAVCHRGFGAKLEGDKLSLEGLWPITGLKYIRDKVQGSVSEAEELGKTSGDINLKRAVIKLLNLVC